MVNKFEDLVVWQKSQDLAANLISHFEDSKKYVFVDQLSRATISISNNIAEDFDRKSKKEFRYFLRIARGSNGEAKSLLYLAKRLQWIDKDAFEENLDLCNQVGKMLNGLISSIKE